MLERELVSESVRRQAQDPEWRVEYNEERPHRSLGYLPPSEFAARETTSYGKDACQKRASLENAEERVSHFPTAPATAIVLETKQEQNVV
jgi:hypothetical protein